MITRTKYFREKYIRVCVALYGIVHEQRVQQLYEMHLDEKLDLTNLNHKFLNSDGIKYDQFMDLLETMNQGGIHRIFMDFYHQVLDQISIQETYEIIQNKYPKILAELLSNRPNLDVTRVFEEQEFLNDFHPIFLANKRAIQQAIQSLESTKLIN